MPVLLTPVVSGNQVKASDLNQFLAAVVAQTHLMSGTTPAVPGPASLTLTYGAQQATIVNGAGTAAFFVYGAAGTQTLLASQDYYVDLGPSGLYNGSVANGSFIWNHVANGAAAPAVATNAMRLWKVVTGASAISAVQLLATGAPRGGVLQCVICRQTSDSTIPANSSNQPYSPTFSVTPGITTLFDNTRVRVRWTTTLRNNSANTEQIFFTVDIDGTFYTLGGVYLPTGSGNIGLYAGVCTTPPLLAGAHTVQMGYFSTGASTFTINAASDLSYANSTLEIEEIA